MNRKYTAVAASALAMGALALTATEASAIVKDPVNDARSGTVVPATAPAPATVEIQVDDGWAEAAQAGASALGGAALAFGALWMYRRRQPVAG